MKVFIDTNAFFNNWFVENVNFKLLFFFLNNENNELLLSNLVIEETNNIRHRELQEIKTELLRLIEKGNKLNQNKLNFSLESLGIEDYDLSTILKTKVDWIKSISYDNIRHKTVVDRALRLVKPFNSEEKGYRDTLIWLSFLEYLKDENIEGDVAFITKNKHDFFKSKGSELTFNSDLQNDIQMLDIKANIKPYLSVYDFVNQNVDKISHSFDHGELLDEIEGFLIEETESYLRNMSNNEISALLDTRIFSDKLTPVINIESDIFEGLEDPELRDVKLLSGNSVYISSYFEMKLVDLVITIDEVEYKQHADEIGGIKALYNIEMDGDYVKLSFLLRTCIDGSFEYETVEQEASGLSIEYICNRRR